MKCANCEIVLTFLFYQIKAQKQTVTVTGDWWNLKYKQADWLNLKYKNMKYRNFPRLAALKEDEIWNVLYKIYYTIWYLKAVAPDSPLKSHCPMSPHLDRD